MEWNGNEIAIIGMDVQLPGSNSLEQFWENLCEGKECVEDISNEALLMQGISPELLEDERYVKRASVCDNYECFDAAFFGYSPYEAEYMDPQHRLFLQSSWRALENAGYKPNKMPMKTGVFGCAGFNDYLVQAICHNKRFASEETFYNVFLGNDKDFLTTRVSYKLGLTGPSVSMQSACSSSLVCIHYACQSLLLGESDCCLAGGVNVNVPARQGYLYQSGFIRSKDGHCCPFDDSGSGTIFASGVGVVVLKRLEDALRDRDTIYSIIVSTAINNDGNRKIGFTAPSQEGQEEVLNIGLKLEGIDPASIAYVEAHGTGTILGDPIELRALINSLGIWNEENKAKGKCAIGSVKSNIGHLDAASGVIGLIKACLCVYNKTIVPTVNFNKINSNISFENTQFYIADKVEKIEREGQFYSLVSSLGIGGTNACVILGEAPEDAFSDDKMGSYLIKVSGKTQNALKRNKENIIKYLKHTQKLACFSYTMNIGRDDWKYRDYIIVSNITDGKYYIQDASHGNKALEEKRDWERCFELYNHIPFFRRSIEEFYKRLNKGKKIGAINIKDIYLCSKNIEIWSVIVYAAYITSLEKIADGFQLVIPDAIEPIVHAYSKGLLSEEEFIIRSRESIVPDLELPTLFQFLNEIGEYWKKGGEIQWNELYEDAEKYHVPTPGYSFENSHFWFVDKTNEDKASFLWTPCEKQLDEKGDGSMKGEMVLLDDGIFSALSYCKTLDELKVCYEYVKGEGFDDKLAVDSSFEMILERLKEAINKAETHRLEIVFFVGMNGCLDAYSFSFKVIQLVRYVNELTSEKKIRLNFVLKESDKQEHMILNGLMKGIVTTGRMEYANLQFKSIWIGDEESLTNRKIVLNEIALNDCPEVILREGKRWSVQYEKKWGNQRDLCSIFEHEGEKNYVITGGTGNVGLLLAKEIAKKQPSNLYLLSLHYTEEELQKRDTQKAVHIMDYINSIRILGSTVKIIKVDITSKHSLFQCLDGIVESCGTITGIIHAAAVVGKTHNFLQDITLSDIEYYSYAKIGGAINLIEYSKRCDYAFLMLISSTTSILGGIGDAIYSGANTVLNFLSDKSILGNENNIISVCFDYLPRVFQDEMVQEDDEKYRSLFVNQLSLNEFSTAFKQMIQYCNKGYYVISKADFNKRIYPIEKGIEKKLDCSNIDKQQFIEDIRIKLWQIWEELVGGEGYDKELNFFDAGGDSFKAIQLIGRINLEFHQEYSVKLIYEYPSLGLLKNKIESDFTGYNRSAKQENTNYISVPKDDDIVVIGIAGRFPGADNVETLWENLLNKKVSISHFSENTEENILNAKPDGRINKIVNARGILNDIDSFDYNFFGISKAEAELMDPQQRLFLECSWQALEDAGCIEVASKLRTAVFATQGVSTYLINALIVNDEMKHDYNNMVLVNNSPDSLATRVSYALNLTGPSKTIQTFCSSSLVTIDEAIDNIRYGKCDLALAGGVNIVVPQKSGYIYNDNSIFSEDGNVRPFDEDANGTVFSNGIGCVVLAKKSWAEQTGRQYYARILASSVNNDGAQKASFLSPSIKGQVECITQAYSAASIVPREISFIETHGTGTSVGDPIEVASLNRVFQNKNCNNEKHCALGAIKGNLGHMDRAAGVAGFIKVCLSLHHRCIPPVAQYMKSNKMLELEKTPFYINTEPVKLTDECSLAGITALGVGGTNVHMVLASRNRKMIKKSEYSKYYILPLSAHAKEVLMELVDSMKTYLEKYDGDMDNVESTLQLYRRSYSERVAIVCNENFSFNNVDFIIKPNKKINTIIFHLNNISNIDILSKSFGEESQKECRIKIRSKLESLLNETIILLFLNEIDDEVLAHVDERTIIVSEDLDIRLENTEAYLEKVDEGLFHRLVARLWVSGISVDWQRYRGEKESQCIHLPVRTFCKTSCWKGKTL